MSRSASSTALHLAEGQWGLLTTAQAVRHNVHRVTLTRLVADGIVERVAHGVYRVRGGPAVPFHELRAAWLLLDPDRLAEERLAAPDAVVSHGSAARLLDLGELPGEPFEFTAPTRRQTRNPLVRFHCRPVPREDWTVADGLPVTVARRTVTDLLAARVDGSHVATVVADALRKGLADADELVPAIAPHAAAYGVPRGDGVALLDHLLELAGAGPGQVADHVAQALAEATPSGVTDATAALAAAANALPRPVRPEVVAAIEQAAALATAVRAAVGTGALDEAARQASAMRAALADPAVQSLLRDAGVRRRLAAQAKAARSAARAAGFGR